MSLLDPSMEDLPVEVIVDILSRLPVKTIIHCKCICKKWQNIILDSYFVDFHLSRSPVVGIMVHHKKTTDRHKTGILKWVEVEDELDHHRLHHDPLMSLDLNSAPIFQDSSIGLVGSVSGLICLWQDNQGKDNTYICNPITREYMILPTQTYYREVDEYIVYGFGVCSLTHEYKVIRIFQRNMPSLIEAKVYTLGTGRWRSLGHVPYRLNGIRGPFLNGCAHWIVVNNDSPEKIYAFDFDKETFVLFPSPPSEEVNLEEDFIDECLGVIKGCLCRCDTYYSEYAITKFTVWVMKEYGIKKSWYKESVIEINMLHDLDVPFLETIYVIEGLKDGTILMATYQHALFVYCPRRKTVVDNQIFDDYSRGLAYRPSFHRLHNFRNERVHVF